MHFTKFCMLFLSILLVLKPALRPLVDLLLSESITGRQSQSHEAVNASGHAVNYQVKHTTIAYIYRLLAVSEPHTIYTRNTEAKVQVVCLPKWRVDADTTYAIKANKIGSLGSLK